MSDRSLLDLPENAIDEILCRLPIRNAVQTSILSRRWRHRWRSIPDLDLEWKMTIGSTFPWPVVTEIFRQHSGHLRLFKIGITLETLAISLWLETLAARASSTLRVLKLDCFCCSSSIDLLALSRCFPHLTHLQLQSCSLDPLPVFDSNAFPFLKTLEIIWVTLPFNGNINHLSLFVPRLSSLETLTVVGANYVGRAWHPNKVFTCNLCSIASDFPRLVHLQISGCNLETDSGLDVSSVSFPALQALNLGSNQLSVDILVYLPVCPLLETLIVRPGERGEEYFLRCDLHWFACNSPSLAHLQISYSCLKKLPDSFPGFMYLKSISFIQVTSSGQISRLVSSCPSLEKLAMSNILYDDECLSIVGPNIRYLRLMDFPTFHRLAITSVTPLDTGGTSSRNCNYVKIFGAIPCIEELELGTDALKV